MPAKFQAGFINPALTGKIGRSRRRTRRLRERLIVPYAHEPGQAAILIILVSSPIKRFIQRVPAALHAQALSGQKALNEGGWFSIRI